MERLNAFFKNYVAELDVAREGSYCGLGHAARNFHRLRSALDVVGHSSVELADALQNYDAAVKRLYAAAADARQRVERDGILGAADAAGKNKNV